MAREAPRGYVVDTNVLSNRGEVVGNPKLTDWLERHATLVRISVVTLAEMHRGLILLETRIAGLTDARVKAREQRRLAWKRAWYDAVVDRFADRIEPIDVAIAQKWAEVSVRFPSLRDADKAIAATALPKGFGVATENLGDFRGTGVALVNPFDPATWDDDGGNDPLAMLLRR